MIELLIQNGENIYAPIVEDGIQLELERKGAPGRLSFTVIKDSVIDFTEGNAVSLVADGAKMFYGFVFTKKRGKDGRISVTAYDQLRYLKNKDTYVYSNKTASEVLKMIAADFNMKLGAVADTGFKIASRVEDNKTLFDIIQMALDLTLQSKKKMYVLFDDYGALTLRDIEAMKLDLLIDSETAQDFDYASTIDGETYDKIKLAYNNEETGRREIYIAQDSSHINAWGVLQYFDAIDGQVNGKAKAEALLSLYNQKERTLTVSGAFGDTRVRAGSTVAVKLDLGDIAVSNYMVVEKIKHTFSAQMHTMNLTLRGGDFIA